MGGGASGACAVAPVEPLVQVGPSLVRTRVGPAACRLVLGLDVGSTTVKYLAVDPRTREVLACDYRRHQTRQKETALAMLREVESRFADLSPEAVRVFVTGSGGASLAAPMGARFVQEVTAVTMAVELLYPDVQSIVELGGQDAKIVVFRADPSGARRKLPSMNDKCAGGTGAVIDKIGAKLGLDPGSLGRFRYQGIRVHAVAAKCGVFAETDINGLQKQGVPADELMASLYESLVLQNLTVLTRGHTLLPQVLLLGGPNTFLRGLQEAWRHHLSRMWEERQVEVPDRPLEELILAPGDGQYFAARGAVEFGLQELAENPGAGQSRSSQALARALARGVRPSAAGQGLWTEPAELAAFLQEYRQGPWEPRSWTPGTVVRGYLGVDGGSTSTKGVILDDDLQVAARSYRLSQGNPIEDAVAVLTDLERQVCEAGGRLEIQGLGTTGYAKDVLKEVLGADVALVETVAHTRAGLHFVPETDVICDVGGQDIKIILLHQGQVKDFKLNTQCAAGNGYFLQGTATSFGIPMESYAETAFRARSMPRFGHGCAVFMQSDIVDFQRQGWTPEEILAGLCDVVPRNIWLYVSQIPNLARLGSTFLLQGGTQHNLAAVKAQVDFIRTRFHGAGVEPRVLVHPFTGEAGAVGCALEAARLHREEDRASTFLGMERVPGIRYRTTRSEDTRCGFCRNKCLRTFLDVHRGGATGQGAPMALTLPTGEEARMKARASGSKVPLAEGEVRLITATCEKGTVEDVGEMRALKRGLDRVRDANPNFAALHAGRAFQPAGVARVAGPTLLERLCSPLAALRRGEAPARRTGLRIGMPRVLNMYSVGPWFMAWFEALGLKPENLVWSDTTSERLYREGSRRGSIDPCFPSKVALAHLHDLLFKRHAKKRLDAIFFPMIDSLPTFLAGVQEARACPAVAVTPQAAKAAFTKEEDLFARHGVPFLDTFLNFAEPDLLDRQLLAGFGELLGLGAQEARRASRVAWRHFEGFYKALRQEAREVLDRLEREDRVGLVLLDRPYHHDPGIGHGIADEIQRLGYPLFTPETLPRDEDLLERLFGAELRRGEIAHPLSVDAVWKNSYSENTSRKVWAAGFAARHPNLVALEMSSFKCGHDAPIDSVVEEIVEASGTPCFSFKDLDENRPAGSIRIRVETIGYFLARHQVKVARRAARRRQAEARLPLP